MNNRRRMIRQTLTIARRDFTATVFTPLFLLFLLSPLIMIALGLIGAIGGSTLARGPSGKDQLIVIAAPKEIAAIRAADSRLRRIFRPGEAPPPLATVSPRADLQQQAQELLAAPKKDVAAVLYGPLDRPQIDYAPQGSRAADFLAQVAEEALRNRVSGGEKPLSQAIRRAYVPTTKAPSHSNQSAFFAVTGIFFLTLFLSGQAVGTMAEERNSKVIEVLAAAVPLESVFLGKLLGMFGVAILFVAFWGTLVSQIGWFLPPGGAEAFAEIQPAIGFPMFVLLFFAYFTMAYMLLGSVFLGVGAQASSMREIQMLSLPITIVQMAMFGLASSAATRPGTTIATIAELFPLSSPFAMAAHAANRPEIWPHLLALAWQLLWVSITIWVGASAFRRGVLKSGSGRRRFFRARRKS